MDISTGGRRTCRVCGTVLSHYNTEPVCAPCSRRPGGIIPASLWDSEPIRAALARRDLAGFALLARDASKLTLRDWQARLGLGWSISRLSMIENGQRNTLFDIRKLLPFVDALGMPRAATPAPPPGRYRCWKVL